MAAGDDWARFSKYVLGVELDGTEPLPLNRLSQGLTELAERERVAVAELASGLQVVRRGLLGDKRAAFDENVDRLVGKDGFLLLAANSFGDVGKRFEATAVQVQSSRYQAYSVLAELLLEIALAFWFAIFSPFAAFEWLAARMAIARTLLRLLETRLGGFLLSMVLEPLEEIVVDLVTQGSQMTGPGLRRHLDKSSILWSGVGGLLATPAAHLAQLAHVRQLGQKLGGHRAGDVADEIFVEGAVEIAIEGVITVATGGTFTAGMAGIAGLSGVFSGVTSASSEFAGERARERWRPDENDHRSDPLPPTLSTVTQLPFATNDPAVNDPASNGPASNGPASNGPASNRPGSHGPGSTDPVRVGPVPGRGSGGVPSVDDAVRFAFGGDGDGGRLVVGARASGTPAVVPPVMQLVWPSTQAPDAVVRANVQSWVREAADRGWQVQVWTPPGTTDPATGWAGTGAVVRSWDSLAQPPVIEGPESTGAVTDVVRLSVLAHEGGLSVGMDVPPAMVSLPVEPLRVSAGAGAVPYLSPAPSAALPAQIVADPVAIRQSVRDALTGPVSLQVIAAPPNSPFIQDVLTDVNAGTATPEVTDAVHTVLQRYADGRGHTFDPAFVQQLQPGHPLTDTARLVPQTATARETGPGDLSARPSTPAVEARPVTPAARDALAEARRLEPLPVEAKPSHRLRRLEQWINQVQPPATTGLTVSPVDCVVRALGAFTAMHGRAANLSEDIAADLVAATRPDVLATAFNGAFTPAPDPETLLRQISSRPGAMTLIHVRPPNRPAHVFWLVADVDVDGKVTPRWVDTQAHGVFAVPASAFAHDSRAQQVRLPGTRVLHLDAEGRPAPHEAPAPTRTLDALLDPSYDKRRAGALPPRTSTEPAESSTPAADAPARPVRGSLNVPGDGLCQIYAVIASAPEQVGRVLDETGRGSDDLREWLRDPAAVRRQVADLLNRPERDRRGLIPRRYHLRQAAEGLRELILDQVLIGGPAGVPVQALQAYRDNDVGRAVNAAEDMESAALIEALQGWGYTSIRTAGVIPTRQLRNAFLDARTDDLAAQLNGDRARARRDALAEVPLKPPVDGSTEQDLADEARSPRAILEYLTGRGVTFDLAGQPVDTLRRQYVAARTDLERPPNEAEFTELIDALTRWEQEYSHDIGEAFLPLLAFALGRRMQINQPRFRAYAGDDNAGGDLIEVYRNGDHYRAGVPAGPPPPVTSVSDRRTAPPRRAADTAVDRTPGPAPAPDIPTTVEDAPPGVATQDGPSVRRETSPRRARRFSVDSLTPRERQIWHSTDLTPAEQASIAPDQVPRSRRQRRITVIRNRRRELRDAQRSMLAAENALRAAPEGQFRTVGERQRHINAALEDARQRWNSEFEIPPRPAEPTPPADRLEQVREALDQDTLRLAMYLGGTPRDVRTERQVYVDLAMDRADHPRIPLTDEQHDEWDRDDADATQERVRILAATERRLAAPVEDGETEDGEIEGGEVEGGEVEGVDELSDPEWEALHAGRLHQRRPMELTITPEQHQHARHVEVSERRSEIRHLSTVLEDTGRTAPLPAAGRRRRFDPIEPIAPGRPVTRPRRTRPGRQLFRTVLATGRRELVTLAAHDEHHWPTGGRRLGVAADLDIDPVSTSDAPEMPAGFNPKTNTDTTNVEVVEPPAQYEYYTVDRATGLSTKEVLDPRERIHETKPLGGYEPGAYAYRNGQRVPVGEPRAQVLTYDEDTQRWDVVPMDTRHVPSPPHRDAAGRPIASDPAETAPAPATSTEYQVLRRNPDGEIHLLTYRDVPEVAPGPDGPGGIYHYHRLDGTAPGWHAGVIPGFPTTAIRLRGTVPGQTSVALVRDTETGLWQPVPTETVDTAPIENPAPPAPPRTFHRLNQTTGNLEDLPIKAIRLDVLELNLGTGDVSPAAFAASVATDTRGLALDPLNNLVIPPATERGSLRFDPDTNEIRSHPGDDPGTSSGGGGGSSGGVHRPGGDRWGSTRPTRGGGAGSQVVTRRVTTTFTRTTDPSAGRPEDDISTSPADDGAPPPQRAPRRRSASGRRSTRTVRSSKNGAGTRRSVTRTTSRTTLPQRVDEPLAGVLDPDRARTAVDSFNDVLITHRRVAPSSLPPLSRTMDALSSQLNHPAASDEAAAGRPLADGALSRAIPAGTGAPEPDRPPLGWGRTQSQSLSTEAAGVLDRRGLHAVAADESGGVLGTVLSSGVLHRVPGMPALTAGAATVSPDSIAGMLLAERTRGGWPLLGLSTVDSATDRAILEWIAAGLSPDAVPEPVRQGLAQDGHPRPGAEVLVHLAATLAGRPALVVRSDGSEVRYGPDSAEPPMVLVADGTGTLLATVPRDAVPAVLAAEPAQVLRPGAPDDPTTVRDDADSLDDLGQVLATVTGVENLPLPGAQEWATRLRTRLVGGDSGRQRASDRADAGLDDTLAAVRDALSDPDRTPAPPPTSWAGVVHQPGDPNLLTREQEDALRAQGLAAVWTRPDGNALFEALRLAGRHGTARLGNVGAVPAASLRSAFSALIRAELARRGESPLTAAERSDGAVGRAAMLDFAARLATPNGVLHPETPHLLGRTMSAAFGVAVEIIGPDGTPHVYQAADQPVPGRPLTLVVDANGHVMSAVPVSAEPGTVRIPRPQPPDPQARLVVPETDAHPSVFLSPPADPDPTVSSDLAGGDLSDRDLSDRESSGPGPASEQEPASDPGSFEYLTDPEPDGPDGGRPGADGQPPIDPVLPPLVLPPADSTVHSIGIPRGTLPYVDEVVNQVRAAAIARGRPIAERQLIELGQRLLGNYRHVAGGGHLVTLDGVELLITMAPSDPRFVPNPAGSYDLVAPGPTRDAEAGRETSAQGRFRANQATHGAFNTGGVSQAHTGQGTSLRGRLALGTAFGVGPGVLQAGKFGANVSGTANESSWTTSQFKDAESGRVEDNRADSMLIAYRPNWTVQMRNDPAQAWNNVPPVWRSQGAEQDPLLVYLPDHYLGDPGPQVTAEDPGPGADRLPDTYFASGVTGLPELYDNIVNQVQAGGVPMPLDSPMRDELRQRLWKLDANLGTAINDGYRITLHDKFGQAAAVVHVRTSRLDGVKRAGATSNVSHLERVRTAIVGQSASHGLKNESNVQLNGGVDLVPLSGVSLGLSAYLGWSWTNTDTTNAGRTGLWVLVSRYSGHTGGYTMPLRHQASVSTVARPDDQPVPTGTVDGTALVRLPEPAAHAHGLPVDARAVNGAQPARPGATRDTGEYRPTGGVLPEHVSAGRGIGMGLARVDDDAVAQLRTRVVTELRERGFLPPDADRPFHQPTAVADPVTQNMQLANLEVVTKFVSGDGLDSHFDQSLQDGLPFTLTVRGPDGKLRSARVTINARQDLRDPAAAPGPVTDPEESPNSRYYQRRTGEYHLVNLAIGTGSGGTRTGGGQKFTVGGRASAGRELLKGLGGGVEYQRSIGASQGVGFVVNRPELLEYPGDVDEFVLPTDYFATIQYDDGTPTMRHRADPVRANVTVHLIPALNTGIAEAGPAAIAGRDTPRRVIDQAVIYHLDTTGLVPAARRLQPELTGVGATNDEEVNNFASQILQRSFLKEALGGQLQTNQLFESGLLADRHGALGVAAKLGRSTFVGATKDQFTLGLIKLWLAQASHSATRGNGITWTQADLALHGDPGSHWLTDLTGEADRSQHWGWNTSKSMSRTGGKELLELDFNRAYAFATTVDFTVQGIRERGGKLVPTLLQHGTEQVDGKQMIYLLGETEALTAYADGDVPISLAQLRDALDRWQDGKLTLSNRLVRRVLGRLKSDYPADDDKQRAWLGGMTETLDKEHRDALKAALIKAGLDSEDSLWHAPYLTRIGPRALGHSGVHDFTFDDDSNMFDLVHAAVEEAAPGLLGARQQDWARRVRENDAQVWYRKAIPGGRSMIGRVPGGLDFLQSIMSGGREQAMFEDMLGEHGLSFFLVNPIADTLADVVEVKLQLVLKSTPRVKDFVGGTGLENYGHAYADQTTGTSRDSTTSSTLPKVGFAGPTGTSGGPELHFADGHHSGVNQTTQNVEEQTAYDWTGEYRFDVDTELRLTVTRLDMVNRPVNNALTREYRGLAGHAEPVVSSHPGNLVLRVPRGLAEAQPLRGPDPVIDMSALPRLPGDSYITTALVDDALPAAEALLARVLGPEAADPRFRSSISLPVLLSRSHLTNHLTKALAGREYLLVDHMFIPGHSSDRVSMWLSGDLYNLRVLAPIVNATGTGRYAKHQSGTNSFSNHDRMRPSVVLGIDQSARTHLNNPANPAEPGATDTIDFSTSVNRVSPRGLNDAATENYRNETHIKQQGEVFLVEATAVLRLSAKRAVHNPVWSTRREGREHSGPITGTVFLEMFADEVAELRARMTAANSPRGRVEGDDPATWPRTDPQSPRFSLDKLLIDAGGQTGDVRRAPGEAARHIQKRLTRPGPIVLTSEPGRRAYEAYTAVRAWAIEHLGAVDPAEAGRLQAEQANDAQRLWQAYGRGPAASADVARTWTKIWNLVDEVNAYQRAPVTLPPEVAAAELDAVHAAREVARDLDRHVQLEDVDHLGNPVVHRIDPAGRVYRLDNLGEPLRATVAYNLLLDELDRVSAYDHDGNPVEPERWAGRRLDADRQLAGIDAVALYGLYRTSWNRGQTFEQAIRGEIGDRDRAREETTAPPVDPAAPAPPLPPADSDTHSARSRRTRPRDGSFAESDRGEVLARMASVRRRMAGQSILGSDTESDEVLPDPDDTRPPESQSLDVPREGASSTPLPPSRGAVMARRQRMLEELGPAGNAALRERAAQIVRRITFGLADNETTTEGYPNRAITSNQSMVDQMRLLMPGDPFRPLQDVADALLFEGPERAEQVAHGLRAPVQRQFDQPLRPPASNLEEVDPNRLDAGQAAELGRLGRYARWTPPDGDCWFTSVLRAARDLPELPPAMADIGVHDPAALRARIFEELVQRTELVDLLSQSHGESEYQEFLGDLLTSGRYGNPMFDLVFDMAAGFLGVRIVIVNRDGLPLEFGNGPAIYLVHNGNHYLPALRLPGTDDAAAADDAVTDRSSDHGAAVRSSDHSAADRSSDHGAVDPEVGRAALRAQRAEVESRLRAYITSVPHLASVREEALNLRLSLYDRQTDAELTESIEILEVLLRKFQREDRPAADREPEDDENDWANPLVDDEPDWWYAGRHTKPGEHYAPGRNQRNWLLKNKRQVGDVPGRGDCAFLATLETVTEPVVSEAVALVAAAAGLPDPGPMDRDHVHAFRSFLGDLVELDAATADVLHLSDFTIVPGGGPDTIALGGFARALRTPEYYDAPEGDYFPHLLNRMFGWASRLSRAAGGTLHVDLRVLSEGSGEAAVLDPDDGVLPTHVLLLLSEYHHLLPTRARPGTGPAVPGGPVPEPAPPGYLAYRWLSGDVPSAGLPEADLSVQEREQAASMSTRSIEEQAASAREHLARALPSLRVSEPVETLPAVQLPVGSRIWLVADDGVARAVYVESLGQYRVFDPSRGAAAQDLLAWDFPVWVGGQRHRYVVAVPIEDDEEPST